MATNYLVPKVSKFSIFLLALAAIMVAVSGAGPPRQLSFFIHDYSSGPSATDVTVTGIPGKLWGFTEFGTINVFDDPITQTQNPNSARVGRMQGVSVTSNLNGRSAHETFAIVFTNGPYNNSRLLFQGINNGQYENLREFAVVGGTSAYRLARGYALFRTVRTDDSKGYMLLRCEVTITQLQQYHGSSYVSAE